jgi:hypothetical protein
MNSSILQVGLDDAHDTPEIYVLSPASVCDVSSNDPSEVTAESIDNIPKTIRNKFYSNIKNYEKKWSATCTLCSKIQYDSKGVTSNINRHIKAQHKKEYEEWYSQLHQSNKSQRKISDVLLKKIIYHKQERRPSLVIIIVIHVKFNYHKLLLSI